MIKGLEEDEKKLVCIFPGIGYTCDKPLLYYAAKLAKSRGYDVVCVNYTGFPKDIRGDGRKIKEAVLVGERQTDEILKDIAWNHYDERIFISKSIGTAISIQYAKKITQSVKHILLTPLKESFCGIDTFDAIAFHGTMDNWAKTKEIVQECEKRAIPLHIFEKANHSLETGDIYEDLVILNQVCEKMGAALCN